METKRTASPFSLAVLSEQINTSKQSADEIGFAALSIEQSENGWCQLLPAGYFKAVDGRPFDVEGGHWFLDEETAQLLIAGLKARANPMVIDYEHQTLLADTNGKEAPASGWFQEAEWRESGLWIKPEWTARASEFIEGKEYRFLSAVFPYNTQTGKPISLHSAALTNTPGLDGLNSVALRLHQINKPSEKEDSLMDRKLLIKQLGLADDATDDQIKAALKQLQDDKLAAEQSLASLKAQPPGEVNPAEYVPVGVVSEMQTQIAALSAQVAVGGLDKVIEGALENGKLIKAMEPWARELGNKDMAALNAYLDKAAPIAALNSQQAGSKTPIQKPNDHTLTEDEQLAAKLTGRTDEEYAALKAK